MKENANPTIYSVKKTQCNGENHNLIGTAVIQSFHFQESRRQDFGKDIDSGLSPFPGGMKSAEERSVYLSLMNIASCDVFDTRSLSVKDEPLGLLRNAGFHLPTNPETAKLQLLQNSILPEGSFRVATTVSSSKADGEMGDKERNKRDTIGKEEVFDIIRNIQDPEHPLTLEQLNVVNRSHIKVIDALCSEELEDEKLSFKAEQNRFSVVDVRFTPTIPHCSMATLIGLCIRVKLLRSLPSRFKVTVRINPGTHASEYAVNKQLGDKERVIAALENTHLLGVVNRCIGNGMLDFGR